jgi:alpha-L-glutamate ligase-like protein
VVRYQHDVAEVSKILDQHQGFCIKPSKGSGGKGILVIIGSYENGYKKASGEYVTYDDIIRHVTNILAGLFSLGGAADVAMIEALIEFDPAFTGLSHEGVPDIRIIVFKGYPMMAMLRLATHASDGKANLHQGAVGVGINIADGTAKAAVQYNRSVSTHPDTGRDLLDIKIDGWQDMLHLSASCYEMSGLGYLGADVVLDRNRGPMILELNARPGLAIQTANRMGMLPRLQAIEGIAGMRDPSIEKRVEFTVNNFR